MLLPAIPQKYPLNHDEEQGNDEQDVGKEEDEPVQSLHGAIFLHPSPMELWFGPFPVPTHFYQCSIVHCLVYAVVRAEGAVQGCSTDNCRWHDHDPCKRKSGKRHLSFYGGMHSCNDKALVINLSINLSSSIKHLSVSCRVQL